LSSTGQTMSSLSALGGVRTILISTLFLVCVVIFIILYIKPSHKWLPHHTASPPLEKTLVSSDRDQNDTVVLIWLWPFGDHFSLESCSSTFRIEGCRLTADRNLYNIADAVLLHHRDIRADLSNLPPAHRPPFQKWVWMNLESPAHSPKKPGLAKLLNVTLNYRRDSDIMVPYGSLVSRREPLKFELPKKDKLVCWIVSNWSPGHARSRYYNELRKHIEIHTYGRAFGKYISGENLLPTIASCKFYLSFENSVYQDYITEKLYNPLSVGSVPIVLGPSRGNYESYIPAGAFIHVEDFPSAKELAEYLQVLDKSEEKYLQYFSWHEHFTVKLCSFWLEHACRTCGYVRRHREYQTVPNFEKWFW
uniref:Fucosyltransferase n=1 Tax=Lepisosteus oculatus TaxID=7918 RepID=W5NMU7_LEPOC